MILHGRQITVLSFPISDRARGGRVSIVLIFSTASIEGGMNATSPSETRDNLNSGIPELSYRRAQLSSTSVGLLTEAERRDLTKKGTNNLGAYLAKLSSIVQLMFFRLKLSDADAKTATSVTPHARARSIPESIGKRSEFE